MAIQTLHDTGESYQITPKMDGAVYASGISDGVCGGVGDEFAINYSSDSLNVYFNAGSQCIIGGSFFKLMSQTPAKDDGLAPNSTIYLCANIDLTKPNGTRGSFVERTSSNMKSENLNGSGTSRDLLLYIIETNSNGVTSVTDKRTFSSLPKSLAEASTLTIQKNGSALGTYTPDDANNRTINVTVPTRTSELVNDFGFITALAVRGFINTSNVLTNQTRYFSSLQTLSWKATANCFVFAQADSYGGISISGYKILGDNQGSFLPNSVCLPIGKDDTVQVSGMGTVRILAFGLKA